MTGAYTQYGPFTDNSAPGISASFLNPLETFLLAINSAGYDSFVSSDGSGNVTLNGLRVGGGLTTLAPITTVKNGSTSGTMTVYEFLTGTSLKIVLVRFGNYKNAAASANNVTLNTPFSLFAHIHSGNAQGLNYVLSGSNISLSAFTTLGGSSDGSATTVTKMNAYSIVETFAGFDTISEPGSNAATRTGNVTIVGY